MDRAALPDSKRIKTTPPTPPPTQPSSLSLSITDLTDDHLVSIASYLPGTSCVNLAVALSAESSGVWLRSDTGKAIISASQDSWEILDFADLFGDVVANKLTDDDIRALLVCIDAKNKVKTLRLRSCTLLVGHGLEPLRGSTVLKDIDLSQNTGYRYRQKTPFSQASILSILENILAIEGGLKKHLNMDRDIPKEWRRESEFVQNLKQLLLSKGTTCDARTRTGVNCLGEPLSLVLLVLGACAMPGIVMKILGSTLVTSVVLPCARTVARILLIVMDVAPRFVQFVNTKRRILLSVMDVVKSTVQFVKTILMWMQRFSVVKATHGYTALGVGALVAGQSVVIA